MIYFYAPAWRWMCHKLINFKIQKNKDKVTLLFHNQHLIWCLKLEMKVLLSFEDPLNFGPHAVEDQGLKIQKLYSLSWVARGSSHKNMHHQLPWFMNKHCSIINTQFNGWLSTCRDDHRQKTCWFLSLTVLQSLCCIMAKDWFRSSNVDRGHRARSTEIYSIWPQKSCFCFNISFVPWSFHLFVCNWKIFCKFSSYVLCYRPHRAQKMKDWKWIVWT